MIPPVNGIGRLRSFKAIVRPAKSAFQNQTAPSSRMLPSVIGGRGRVLGVHRLSHRCHASALAMAIIPQGLEVGADGIVVEGLPNALHGEKSFGLAVPGRCFADLSCEITKLLLNFTNYTGCG